MKIQKQFLIFVMMLVCTTGIFTQNKQAPQTPVYYSSSPNGNIGNAEFSTTPFEVPGISQQEKNLEIQLDAARLSSNTMAAQQIRSQLDNLRGQTNVYPERDPRMHFMVVNEPPVEGDYQVSMVHNRDVWSNAVATIPVGNPGAGNLWLVTTDWGSGSAADTLKFYTSNNGGVSWSYWGLMWLSFNHDFRADELDIEIVYDNTSVFLFGVAGLNDLGDGGRKKVMFFRANLTSGAGYATILNPPGNVAGNNFYNPRLVSDASNYTSNAYVMILCSMDSLNNGSNHFLKQKYVLSTLPFGASPSLNYAQPSGSTGFYWSCNCSTASYYLYGDIGYYRDDGGSGANRIYAVYSNPTAGYNQLWLAWVNNYSTFGGSITVAETNYNYGARIAFNGGASNRFGMISIVRQYSGTDWDPYYYRTTNGGTTIPDWSNGFIDASLNRGRRCDIVAVRGGSNQFRACYLQDNPTAPSAFFTSWTGSSWSTPRVISNTSVDTMYSTNRAAYLNGGGDDCLGIWGTSPTGTYASRLCNTTVGIQPTGIPVSYSLLQNYPNPFNPNTTISFGLPKASNVKLTVYNILGEAVAVLVDGYKTAGTYDIDFNASNLASGVYMYKLETTDFTNVKKMLLVK